MTVRAYAASAPKSPLAPFAYDLGPLGSEDVEIAVEHCGICHSDLSMIDNEWQRTQYPLVAGHEVVGTVRAAGPGVKRVAVGDRVGVGWYVGSCLACRACTAGDLHLCADGRQTIVGRHGGFSEAVRCHWSWALPLPAGLDPAHAGPLFCGGITVFTPIAELGVKPTDRVGVVGLGGLGHLALQFLHHWGCEVFAFSSNPAKGAEANALGAHHVVGTHDKAALKALRGTLDFILVTANVTLDWPLYLAALAPRGRLHVVGAVLDPIPVQAFALIGGQKALSGSPVGSPATTLTMLDFCVRHGIAPRVERYPMSRINDALAHLRAGKARYRIVLDNDFR
ncbi:MAG TPA: NAD(P)-dependent alcohol dehydrogenase [Xanthomonadales bacterium]|nr:NAD(P)-dependent alcohol dehydrogenase [Xanthomonadales bacterium]